jgi:hypothetical protein
MLLSFPLRGGCVRSLSCHAKRLVDGKVRVTQVFAISGADYVQP